jgi:quinol monooxygenase YgiN
MVLSTVRMVIPPEKRPEAVQILNAMAERTRGQLGCLSCRIYHDEQVEAVFMVEELWMSQEDLDRHLRSDDYRHALFVTEMAVEPPEIKFQTVSHSAGIEVIEKARGCTRE